MTSLFVMCKDFLLIHVHHQFVQSIDSLGKVHQTLLL